MDNIYGQTELERNSVVEVPEGAAEKAGDTLFSWLGSVWRDLGRDGMVRGLQRARGILLAQMYVDAAETARLNGRLDAPVLHRELWYPVRIRRSGRDRAQENLLLAGVEGELGPQPEGSAYGEGTVFRMGRMAGYGDFVTYPVDPSISGGASTIADNPVNPSVLLEGGDGKDFVVRNGSVIFPRGSDPLADGSPFEKFDVPADDPAEADVEAVLWASDVLFDLGYVADHISYALGASAPSTPEAKRVVNAAWTALSGGSTPSQVRTLMAAMLNIPVIQGEEETVVKVESGEFEWGPGTVVYTDRGEYRVSPKARLRDAVRRGAVLRRGELLDESLRVYPFLNSSPALDDPFSASASPFSEPLAMDVPSVVVPPCMCRAATEFGVYAMWTPCPVREDAGGRPYFDIGGRPADVEAFWRDVWSAAEASGTDLRSVIERGGAVRPSHGGSPEGASYSSSDSSSDSPGGETLVSPAAFLLRNLVGANTVFAAVDASQLDDPSMMRDPMFFDMLSRVVPSAVRLAIVEREPVGGEGEDEASMDGGADGPSEECLHSASLRAEDRAEAASDDVRFRLVRVPPRRERGSMEGRI